MAVRTYKVSKGRDNAALIQWEGMLEEITSEGTHRSGDVVRVSDREAILVLAAQVIATGEAQTLTVGTRKPVLQWAKDEAQREACPSYTKDQGCPLHGEMCADWGR